MKLRLIIGAATLAVCVPAWGGCLSALETTTSVVSKVRGLYVHGSGTSAVHYVILDKSTCTAGASGDATLGATTKSEHYLRFREADKALMSVLLSAQAQQTKVAFRLMPGAATDNINDIVYVVSPSDSTSQ